MGLVAGFFLACAAVGCVGPGLEPPGDDTGGGRGLGASSPVGNASNSGSTSANGGAGQSDGSTFDNGEGASPTGADDSSGTTGGMTSTDTGASGSGADAPGQPATSEPNGGTAGAGGATGTGDGAVPSGGSGNNADGMNDGGVDPGSAPVCEPLSDEYSGGGGTQAACELPLPDTGGASRGFELVGVDIAPFGTPTPLQAVADVSECDPLLGGFYFDDPDAPGEVRLCPMSCAFYRAGADVTVTWGCPDDEPAASP